MQLNSLIKNNKKKLELVEGLAQEKAKLRPGAIRDKNPDLV